MVTLAQALRSIADAPCQPRSQVVFLIPMLPYSFLTFLSQLGSC